MREINGKRKREEEKEQIKIHVHVNVIRNSTRERT